MYPKTGKIKHAALRAGLTWHIMQEGMMNETDANLQFQADKGTIKQLATLTAPGSSAFLTLIKPCGILLPHVHQRASELYVILSGALHHWAQSIVFGGRHFQVFVRRAVSCMYMLILYIHIFDNTN